MHQDEGEDIDESDENNFESYSEDELGYQDEDDAGFGDEQSGFDHDHQFADDDISSSLNSAGGPGSNQERDAMHGYGPELSFNENSQVLNRLNVQLENREFPIASHFNSLDLRELGNQLASCGSRRGHRHDDSSRSRSRSAHSSNSQSQSLQMSQQGARTRPLGVIHHDFSDRGNILSGLTGTNTQYKRREHEDNFWNNATQELATVSKEVSSIKILSKRIVVFNQLLSRIIEQLQSLHKSMRIDENLFL